VWGPASHLNYRQQQNLLGKLKDRDQGDGEKNPAKHLVHQRKTGKMEKVKVGTSGGVMFTFLANRRRRETREFSQTSKKSESGQENTRLKCVKKPGENVQQQEGGVGGGGGGGGGGGWGMGAQTQTASQTQLVVLMKTSRRGPQTS